MSTEWSAIRSSRVLCIGYCKYSLLTPDPGITQFSGAPFFLQERSHSCHADPRRVSRIGRKEAAASIKAAPPPDTSASETAANTHKRQREICTRCRSRCRGTPALLPGRLCQMAPGTRKLPLGPRAVLGPRRGPKGRLGRPTESRTLGPEASFSRGGSRGTGPRAQRPPPPTAPSLTRRTPCSRCCRFVKSDPV